MSAQAFQHGLAQRDPRDKFGRAVVLAVGIHVALLAAIVISSWLKWNTDSSAAAGEPTVEATLAMSAADIKAAERALQDTPPPPQPKPIDESAQQDAVPPPQPLPEPNPQTALEQQQKVAQERVQNPDTKEQDEASKLAISQQKAAQEQEARHRQEQIELTEQIKKREEAQQKQRLAQQQADLQKQQAQQAADADKQKKLDEIRKQREQLAKEVAQAQQKQQQIADAQRRAASSANAAQSGAQDLSPAGSNGSDDGLQAKYAAALQAAVLRQWIRPDSVQVGTKCSIVIRQLPGGEVMDVQVNAGNCAMSPEGQESVKRAVLKAQPLPYRGFESVFQRTITFNFVAQNH